MTTILRALLVPVLVGLGACVPMPGDPGEPCHDPFGCGEGAVCVPDGQDGVCRPVVEVCGQDCEAGQRCDPVTKVCIDADAECSAASDPIACDDDLGECVAGTQSCIDGHWGPCIGAVGPVDEIPCDGKDNDCDGDQDDDDACEHGHAAGCDVETGLCRTTAVGSCVYAPPGGENTSAAAMCLVPGGDFALGELAQTEQVLTFVIDQDEVTNARYRAYYDSLGVSPTLQHLALPTCTPDLLSKSWTASTPHYPPGLDGHPVSCVSEAQAAAFCAWAGKRLPTEKEWEAAAAGESGLAFPWGDAFVPGRANCLDLSCHDVYAPDTCVQGLTTCPDTAPVDKLSSAPDDGRSPFGLTHLAGNVAEWTAAVGASAAVKGGSFDDLSGTLRHWQRDLRPTSVARPTTGFRCALTPP